MNISIFFCIVVHGSIFLLFLLCVCVEDVSVFWFAQTTLLAHERRHTWRTYCSVCSGLSCFPWMEWALEAGKIKRETDRRTNRERERDRESWGKPTLWLRGEVREFPGELDSFYIWSDWSVAWSSAAPQCLGCSREKSGLIHLCFRLVQLTAKTKRILSYSIICNIKTVRSIIITPGCYSRHVKAPQQQAWIFGLSFLQNRSLTDFHLYC